jgi:hypothetical protein
MKESLKLHDKTKDSPYVPEHFKLQLTGLRDELVVVDKKIKELETRRDKITQAIIDTLNHLGDLYEKNELISPETTNHLDE